jgi:hypothetical protein
MAIIPVMSSVHAVDKSRFTILLLLATLAAMAAVWFWALSPLLTLLGYIYPSNWNQADLVRHIWHFQLVQPEWVSSPPDYMRWSEAETLARLSVVFICWLVIITFNIWRYCRSGVNRRLNNTRHTRLATG